MLLEMERGRASYRPTELERRMPQPRTPSPLRRAFNTSERLIGRPLETLGQSPLVNTAVIIAARGQARALRTAEELAALTVNTWGFASRRDIKAVLRRLADIERAVLEVEHRVEEASRVPQKRPPGSGRPHQSGRARTTAAPAETGKRGGRGDGRTLAD